MMKSALVSLTALCLLAGCNGASTTPTPTPTPAPAPTPTLPTGTNPANFLRTISEPDGIGGRRLVATQPIVSGASPSGKARLEGIATLEKLVRTPVQTIAGDATLDVDFDASTMSGKVQRLGLYAPRVLDTPSGLPATAFDATFTPVRAIDGEMTLSGTLTQSATSLTGELKMEGRLADTQGSLPLGEISTVMEGGIGRISGNGKLIGSFVQKTGGFTKGDRYGVGSGTVLVTEK